MFLLFWFFSLSHPLSLSLAPYPFISKLSVVFYLSHTYLVLIESSWLHNMYGIANTLNETTFFPLISLTAAALVGASFIRLHVALTMCIHITSSASEWEKVRFFPLDSTFDLYNCVKRFVPPCFRKHFIILWNIVHADEMYSFFIIYVFSHSGKILFHNRPILLGDLSNVGIIIQYTELFFIYWNYWTV